ncbi:MAG: alpha/beta fold hydrolase [Planctomycetes bacterium]|nr:alpha/beta fold hydrolase [Planctomycetota bacterium]
MNPNKNVRRLGLIMALTCFASIHPRVMADPQLMGGMVQKPKPDFKDRVVTFNSPDGVTVVGDYYPLRVESGQLSPAVILIHMYPKNRASWKAFAGQLRDKGMSVLAYDIRGNGDSVKPESLKLAEGYKSKTPAHFQNASLDVMGALDFLRQLEYIDMSRVALVGASIGCSISLDAATRTNDIRGIVCLSPGVDYFGVDSLSHIKTCASYTPILLLSPEGEFEAVQKLAEAGGAKVETGKYEGGREYHGTNLLDAPYGKKVNKRITKFVKKVLSIAEPAKKDAKDKKDGKTKKSGGKKKSKDAHP